MLTLEDEREITRLMTGYAWGIDSRNYDIFRTSFDDEIVAEYPSNTFTTGDAITAYMEARHRDLGPTLHRNTNVNITEVPDGASVITYVDAVLTARDASTVWRARGYYDDLVIRTQGGWKIKKRRFVPVLTDPLPPVSPADIATSPWTRS